MVYAYRWLAAPFLGGHCRFWPSCSDYALAVLASESPGRALRAIVGRLARCHPFHPSGVDLP